MKSFEMSTAAPGAAGCAVPSPRTSTWTGPKTVRGGPKMQSRQMIEMQVAAAESVADAHS